MSADIRAALTALVEMYEHNGRCSPIASANGRDYSPDEEAAWGLARAALAAPVREPLTAWITEGGCECLQQGNGPVRAMPAQCDETGFTVPLYASPQAVTQPLTDSQAHRLYQNIKPSQQQDARSFAAFRRLVALAESAHGIGAARPQAEQGGDRG